MAKQKINTCGKSNDKAGEIGNWTLQMSDCLIDALMHEANVGNRVNGTFTSTAYILQELAKKLRREITKNRVKNRLNTIKNNFTECYDIFKGGMSGFSWNPLTNMWAAEPEVWNALIEALKPEAKKWVNTSIHNYEKLLILFGKDRANGLGAATAKKKARQLAAEIEQEDGCDGGNTINDIDHMVRDEYVFLQSFQSTDGNQTFPSTKSEATAQAPKKSTTYSSSKKRKEPPSVEEAIIVKESTAEFAGAMHDGNEIMKERYAFLKMTHQRVYTSDEIYEELLCLGVDTETRLNALNYFLENPPKVSGFFSCRSEEHVQFMTVLLRKAGFV